MYLSGSQNFDLHCFAENADFLNLSMAHSHWNFLYMLSDRRQVPELSREYPHTKVPWRDAAVLSSHIYIYDVKKFHGEHVNYNYLIPWERVGLAKWPWRQKFEKQKQKEMEYVQMGASTTMISSSIEWIKQLLKSIKLISSQIWVCWSKFMLVTRSSKLAIKSISVISIKLICQYHSVCVGHVFELLMSGI